VSHGVFINYRREDAGPYARLMKIRLAQHFPGTPVFMDLDSIEAGVDFAEAIDAAVRSCAILIALIGRRWLTITDDEGHRRLDNPDDLVRFEIQAALECRLRVIPVLVDGAVALRQQQLPPALCKLARLNALEMSYGRFEYDETRLLGTVEKVLASTTTQTPPADHRACGGYPCVPVAFKQIQGPPATGQRRPRRHLSCSGSAGMRQMSTGAPASLRRLHECAASGLRHQHSASSPERPTRHRLGMPQWWQIGRS
jgi:hypothetical protein